MQREEEPAVEHLFVSPAPQIEGASLVTSVETKNGHLLEEWFALGEGTIFRTCVRDSRGWVPHTQSKPVPVGNAWINDPSTTRLTIDAEATPPVAEK